MNQVTNLVIGSEGFIGKPFCSYLERLGEKVIRFDITRSKKEDARNYRFNFRNFSRVYFLAWDVGGSKYLYQENNQLEQLHWNMQLLSNVMDQLEKQKPRFLFVSSQLSEEGTVYGTIKRLGELWTSYLNGVTVRVWNAYGILEKIDIKSHVISDFIYQAVRSGRLKMLTTGEEWRQFTHIDDISKAFHLALFSSEFKGKIYDICSYEKFSIREVAELIISQTGAKCLPGKRIGRIQEATNIGRLPGWLPAVDIKAGINRMILQAKELSIRGNI